MSANDRNNATASELRSEIEAELESHLELFVEEQVLLGVDPEQARMQAEHRFGNRRRITSACLRVTKGESFMNRSLFLGLGALVLVGLGLFATQMQIRQLQVQRESKVVSAELFRSRKPVKPEQIIARVGANLTLVARSGLPNEFCGEYRIQRDGMILLPEVGWYLVAGKSRPELELAINKLCALYHNQPSIIDVVVEESDTSLLATAYSGL